MTVSLQIPLVLGICGPQECTLQDYNSLKPELERELNNLLQELGKGTALEEEVITQDDIVFRDPYAHEEMQTRFGAGFWCVLVFGMALCAFIVVATYFYPEGASGDLRDKRLFERILRCFSAYKNGMSLFVTSKREDPNLRVFSGLRVLGMGWIICAHTFYFHTKELPVLNPQELPPFMKRFSVAYIYNGTYAVDIFFFLSAFLLTYVLLKQARARNNKLPYGFIYLHRIIRLYPLLIFTLLIFCFIVPAFGSGPLFYVYDKKVNYDCGNYWATTVFYIQNFINSEIDCMGWTWYLALDMQFFLLAPILLFIYLKSRRWGIITIIALFIGSFILQIVLAIVYNLSLSPLLFSDDYFNLYYRRPYNRIPAYLFGLVAALIYEKAMKEDESVWNRIKRIVVKWKMLRIAMYVLGSTGMFFIVYSMYWINLNPYGVGQAVDVLYLAFSRPVFVISLFVVIFPALVGKGRILNLVLGHPVFNPFARTTYGAYLIHEILMLFIVLNYKTGYYMIYSDLLFLFVCFFIVSYIFAIILSLGVEAPVIRLETEFLRPKPKNVKKTGLEIKSPALEEEEIHDLIAKQDKDQMENRQNKHNVELTISQKHND